MDQSSRVIQVLADLVSIESVNVAHTGGGRGEIAVAQYVDAFCQRLGLTRVPAGGYPDRPNSVWRLQAPNATGTLMFEAHMDTVSLVDMPDGTCPRIADGRLYGRGACDTKGSLAAMLCAVEDLATNPDRLNADLLLAAVVDEEVCSQGAQLLLDAGVRADAAIVGEPTSLQPLIAHMGYVRFFIDCVGKAAHTSRPELGNNAILQAAEVIRMLRDKIEPAVTQLSHPLVGHAHQTITLIQGGHTINFVPAKCRIGIDRRTLPQETHEAVMASYREALTELCRCEPWINAQIGEERPPAFSLDTPADSPVAQAALAGVRDLVDPDATHVGNAISTDAARYWHEAAIPCVVLGPGNIAQAHTADEWIDLGQLAKAVLLYKDIARRYAPAR